MTSFKAKSLAADTEMHQGQLRTMENRNTKELGELSVYPLEYRFRGLEMSLS